MQRLFSLIVLSTVMLTACGGGSDTIVPTATTRVEVTALAGPICPVETDPPSPECAPRPVDAALIIVTDVDGTEVGRGTTGADGIVIIDVPPGERTVVPQAVEGLLGTAEAASVTVADGQAVSITVEYDTGIR